MTTVGIKEDDRQDINVKIVVRPGIVVRWAKLRHYPLFSIALDGFCYGPTRFSKDGCRINLNHHEGVNDVAVRATCGQARVLVKQQLYAEYRDEVGPKATLYVNDCDQDVCLATYVLMNPHQVGRPLLRELVNIEDHLDSSGGLYQPDNDELRKMMRTQAWIFEPYTVVRVSGVLPTLNGDAMLEIIDSVHERIRLYLYGHGKQKERLDTKYEVISQHEVWHLVRETGAEARTGMMRGGIRAFVSILGEHNGRYRYSLARLNPSVPFPVRDVLECLNRAEGIGPRNIERWGGGSNRGGSPRIKGSRLPPEEVERVIEECIRRWKTETRRLRPRRWS
jgi:hypothetical protein